MIRKLLGIKGELPVPISEITLESDRPEFSFIKGEYLFVARGTIATVAANGAAQVFNPVGSGVIVVVTEASVEVTVLAAQFIAVLRDAAQTTLGPAVLPLDTRWFAGQPFTGTAGRSGIQFRTSTSGVGGGTSYLSELGPIVPIGGLYRFTNLPIVLGEGTGLDIESNGAATNTWDVNFGGYVRPRETGELTPGQ
jgi:hypothetical protein